MIHCENTALQEIALHHIGRKTEEEGILFSRTSLPIDEELQSLLVSYFISPFDKAEEYYGLYHESDLSLNEVFSFVSHIFDDPASLYEESVRLARHLYEQSGHPQIKSGEFYVAYFDACRINGETTDAVGLFKSENKDTFLKVFPSGDGLGLESQQGININKLDKGCMIFNTQKEDGYLAALVDHSGKGAEARYWTDGFLHVQPKRDEYFITRNVLSFCKHFVTKELPQEFEVSKAEQADLLNRSLQFFQEQDTFDLGKFTEEVIGQPEVIDSFQRCKTNFMRDREIEITDNFAISGDAVKKQARNLKSVIKLDKNFHIYIHGGNRYIRKGYDEENGLNYYQLFFREEE